MSDVFGTNSGELGILGTGMYEAKPYTINMNAYNNASGLNTMYDKYGNQIQSIQNQQSPTIGQTQLGPSSSVGAIYGNATTLGQANQATAAQLSPEQKQFRNAQMGLTSQLQAAAAGRGPSLAASQLGQANAAAAASRMSQAASQRGYGNTAATLREGAYQQGAANQATAMQAAQTRIQEQQAAQQALGNLLGTARGQDIGAATENAQLTQQARLANQAVNNQFLMQNAANQQQMALANLGYGNQAATTNANAYNQFALQQGTMNQQTAVQNAANQLQMMGLNDTQIANLLGAQTGIQQQILANQQAGQELQVKQATALQQINQQAFDSAAKARSGLIGGIGGAIAGAAMLSDEKEKENVSDISNKESDDLLKKDKDKKEMGYGLLSSSLSKLGGDNDSPYAAMGSSILQAGLKNIAMSDKDEKNTKGKGTEEVKDFIDNIGAHKYTYKHPDMPGANDKINYGPMAQELEKSEIGKSMVGEDENGTKYVDYSRGVSALMAVTAQLNERLKKLEKGKGKK